MSLAQILYSIKDNAKELSDEEIKFFGYCCEHINLTKSQCFQDIWAQYNMFPNDFFVEFGATDGFEISNTFMLEKDFGWKGILAEPNPEWHQKLKENRREMIIDTRAVHSISGQKLNFVCTKAADLATLEEYKDSDYHSRNRQQVNSIIQVETVSLNDLLEQHSAPKEIGYISIDTEGSEYDIIKTFDFDKWNVMKFSIEHNYNDANRNRIKELMNAKGYTRVFEAFSRWDDFYEKQP